MTPWDAPIAPWPNLVCVRTDEAATQEILTGGERQLWEGMGRAVPKRRQEWLMGRAAGKRAVALLARRRGLEVNEAEVEILKDEEGKPVVAAPLGTVVSIAHAGGAAAAIAAFEPLSVGLDFEPLQRDITRFARTAFAEEERRCLEGLGARPVWALRLWCAKEAAGKALGRGLFTLLRGLCVVGVSTDGWVEMEVRGRMLAEFPQWEGRRLKAYSGQDDRLAFATAVIGDRSVAP